MNSDKNYKEKELSRDKSKENNTITKSKNYRKHKSPSKDRVRRKSKDRKKDRKRRRSRSGDRSQSRSKSTEKRRDRKKRRSNSREKKGTSRSNKPKVDSRKRRSTSSSDDYEERKKRRKHRSRSNRKRSRSRSERRSKRRSKSRNRNRSISSECNDKQIKEKSNDKKLAEECGKENETVKLNYDPDSFIERKPKKKVESESDNDEDPLDAFMKSLPAVVDAPKTKSNAKTIKCDIEDDLNNDEENDDEEPAEEETLESLTKEIFEAKSKKLTGIDHDKIYYRKYNFNLYNEVPEIKNLSDKEVKEIRKKHLVTIKGKDCPKPITKWSQAIVNQKVLDALRNNRMTEPTAIQGQTIPAIMSGKDVIGIAKTGSGKTLAYLLPMIRHIQNQPQVDSGDGPISIILCPTRELSIQIYQEVQKITYKLKGIRCCCIYGGSDIAQQINVLKKGAEIVVGTPGRMIDILCTNAGKNLNMGRCTFIVLDEADRMFDMGFEPQVFTIVKRIRPDRQTVMFSATFPRKIEAVAKKILKEPIEIRVGGGNKVCNDVTQYPLLLQDYDKFMKLHDILASYDGQGKCLVFVEKQETAVMVCSNLNHQNIYCTAIHGGMSQDDREQAIINFKNASSQILIATSIAARGLDINDLVAVINYDCPSHYEDYVHRCGRTGRAGKKGDAYTFILPDQEMMIGHIIKAMQDNKQRPGQDLIDAYAQYKSRMNQEGKAIQCPSGFKGHGFKFDATEAMKEKEKKLKEMKIYCPNDVAEEEESALDDMKTADKFGATTLQLQTTGNLVTSQSINAHIQIAKNFAMGLDQRLETSGVITKPLVAESQTVKEIMFINDIAERTRRNLTSKELRTNLFENFNVTLLVKGVYMTPKQVANCTDGGEKPLHLLLESDLSINIDAAKKEIFRTAKEAMHRN